MRFLLFNIVVGVALLNLFGGGLDLNDLKQRFLDTEPVAEMVATPVATPAATAPIAVAATQGPGSGRDVIEEPKPPVKKPVTKPVKKPKRSNADTALPQLAEARTIESAPEPKVVPNAAPKTMPDAVAQRRAEVLADGPAKPTRRVALKAGSAMMSTTERRRELDALVEEMEMLYLDKIGG